MRKLVVFLAASLAMGGCAVAPTNVAPSPKPDAEARLRANGVLSHNGSQLVAAGAGNALPKAGIVSAGAGNAVPNGAGLVAAGAGNAIAGNGAGLVAAGAGNAKSAIADSPPASSPSASAIAMPTANNGGGLVGNNGNAQPGDGGGGMQRAGFADLAGFAPGSSFAIGAIPMTDSFNGPKTPKVVDPGTNEEVVTFDAAIAGKLRAPGAGGALGPVKGVKVRLFAISGAESGAAVTGDDGGYTLSAKLPAGVYALRAAFTGGPAPTYLAALVDVAGAKATADLDPGTTMLEAHLFAAAEKAGRTTIVPPAEGALAGWNQALSALASEVPEGATAPNLTAGQRDALSEGLRKKAEAAFTGVAALVAP